MISHCAPVILKQHREALVVCVRSVAQLPRGRLRHHRWVVRQPQRVVARCEETVKVLRIQPQAHGAHAVQRMYDVLCSGNSGKAHICIRMAAPEHAVQYSAEQAVRACVHDTAHQAHESSAARPRLALGHGQAAPRGLRTGRRPTAPAALAAHSSPPGQVAAAWRQQHPPALLLLCCHQPGMSSPPTRHPVP